MGLDLYVSSMCEAGSNITHSVSQPPAAWSESHVATKRGLIKSHPLIFFFNKPDLKIWKQTLLFFFQLLVTFPIH